MKVKFLDYEVEIEAKSIIRDDEPVEEATLHLLNQIVCFLYDLSRLDMMDAETQDTVEMRQVYRNCAKYKSDYASELFDQLKEKGLYKD